MSQDGDKMLRTILILSFLISSISAVNNFGADLELGVIKPEAKRMVAIRADAEPLKNKMTNSVDRTETQSNAVDHGSKDNRGSLYNGDKCDTGGKPCIPEAECLSSLFVCVCKTEGKYGKHCTESDGAFFATGLQPNTDGINGDEFVQIQSRTHQSLKPFESLMTLNLGDHCDTSLISKTDPIIQYFGGLVEVKPSELDSFLAQAEEVTLQSKPMCDFRRFLKCDSISQKCNHYADGVVDTEQSGSNTVYKLGGGSWCFDYPKIFDSTVEVRCAENTHGACARATPGICTCKSPAGGLLCTETEVVPQTERSTQPEPPKQPEPPRQPQQPEQSKPAVDSGSPVILENQKVVLTDDVRDGTLGIKMINSACNATGPDDCDLDKKLRCQKDPNVAVEQSIDHDNPAVPGSLAVEFFVSDPELLGARLASGIPYTCQCQEGYLPLKDACLFGPNHPCKGPRECASGFCLADTVGGNRTCSAKLNGLFFINSVYLSEAGSLGPAWIVNFVSLLSVFAMIVNFNHR